MAHPEQIAFCQLVKQRFPQYFRGMRILDAGSQDINGNNRYLFEDCDYFGIDLGPGNNVDLVCPMHEYDPDEPYDVVISTEAFEHDKHFEQSVQNIVRAIAPGGLFLMTCAGEGRPEHGTDAELSWTSPHTLDFYQNRTIEDFTNAINFKETFGAYSFEYNDHTKDLYFWGVKQRRAGSENPTTFFKAHRL